MYRRLAVTACFLLVFLGTAAPVGAQTGAIEEGQSASGIAVTVSEEREQRLLEQQAVIAELFGLEERDRAFLLVRDGTNHVVYADDRPSLGEVRLIATRVDIGDRSVLFADSVTEGSGSRTVSLSRLREVPSQYAYERVRLRTTLGRRSYLTLANQTLEPHTVSSLGSTAASNTTAVPESARWVTMDLAAVENASRSAAVLARTGGVPVHRPADAERSRWLDGEVLAELVVFPAEERGALPGVAAGEDPVFLLAETSLRNVVQTNVTALTTDPASLEGEVVRFEAGVMGRRTSARDLLMARTDCDPGRIRWLDGWCGVASTDVIVHTGVAFNATAHEQGESAVVRYAGLSNRRSLGTGVQERGTYEVTGRVVPANQLAPGLEGQAVMVTSMNQTGPLVTADIRTQPGSRARALTTRIEDAIVAPVESTPTPTATPTPTPTPSPTPTPTPTPTPSPTPSPTPTPTATPTPSPTPSPTPTPTAAPTPRDRDPIGVRVEGEDFGTVGPVPTSAPGFGPLLALAAVLAGVALLRRRH
jgi:PGF-CTERM protein